ncbi:mediator of RNA polymerase II transcription subunit 31-A isoform X3 [Condylostylus longicornis]|uniref:mediator of RNA polymerase II transcription subunit 31-A isoform X3 n=2 Tax=Condylostylus longicornis TaxID=2530218 RepID=UPI00244E02BB|nr:mediator of RNA polymerase II transcription subunit 31-A isoform X3 [Condylostylus longicornis]
MSKMYGKGKSGAVGGNMALKIESEENAKLRLQIELEFVQCLGNPNYLNFLAQRGYFKDQTFINYLKYLLYWKEPEYAKYIMYPICLYFLDLLQYEHFRREIANTQCCKFIDDQAILLWQHYTRRRTKLLAQNDNANMSEHHNQNGSVGNNSVVGGNINLNATTPQQNGILQKNN